MNKNYKKMGFALVELMAVIAILAILAAVLVSNVAGYINKSKKHLVFMQAKSIVQAVESYNIFNSPINDDFLGDDIGKGVITILIENDFLDGNFKLDKLSSKMAYSDVKDISDNISKFERMELKKGVLYTWKLSDGGTYINKDLQEW